MRSTILVLTLLLCPLAGCSTGSPPGAEPRHEVAAQRRVWQQSGLDSYRFDFQQECYCVREQVQPVTIEVRGGRIERVVSRESGVDLTGDPNLRWPTIAELFDRIVEAEESGVEPIATRYDPELGYPTSIEIGSLAADAGVVYSVSDLEPL